MLRTPGERSGLVRAVVVAVPDELVDACWRLAARPECSGPPGGARPAAAIAWSRSSCGIAGSITSRGACVRKDPAAGWTVVVAITAGADRLVFNVRQVRLVLAGNR